MVGAVIAFTGTTVIMGIRLSDTQRTILSSVMLRARTPLAKVARELKLREHTIRYCLDELREAGVIRPFALIDVHALGFTDYCLFFSLRSDSRASRNRLMQLLVQSPQTAWVAELSGEFSHTVSLFARDIVDVQRFLESLASAKCGALEEKAFAVRVSWSNFRCKYLWAGRSSVNELVRRSGSQPQVLDALDARLLATLSTQGLLPNAKLAKLLDIAESTLSYRMKRLEQRKVILGYLYYVDAQQLGYQTARLLVYERHTQPDLSQQLQRFARAHPHITGFVHCVGSWDYELNLEVPNAKAVNEIAEQVQERFEKGVRTIRPLQLVETQKIALYPFVGRGSP